jgi:hypothetical protein
MSPKKQFKLSNTQYLSLATMLIELPHLKRLSWIQFQATISILRHLTDISINSHDSSACDGLRGADVLRV